MNYKLLKNILEAALLVAGQPLDIEKLKMLFDEGERPDQGTLRNALQDLSEDCETRGIELKEVASGFRLQVKQAFVPWLTRLNEERTPRYSRALLETLALIAYRQPISRAEIEDVRGVSVSTHIIKTLQERRWIRVVGHREVPGKPVLYGTTCEFLNYFDLKTLNDLPPLSEICNLDILAEGVEAVLTQQIEDPEERENVSYSTESTTKEKKEAIEHMVH